MVKKNVETPLNIITSILSKGINNKLNVMKGGGNDTDEILKKYNCIRIKNIERSQGDCGVDSIVYLIEYDKYKNDINKWENDRDKLSTQYRKKVCEYLKDKEDLLLNVEKNITLKALGNGPTYKEKIKKFSNNGNWIDELFIAGASNFSKICINVIKYDNTGIQTFCPINPINLTQTIKTINIYNEGNEKKKGVHYFPLLCNGSLKNINKSKPESTKKPTKQPEPTESKKPEPTKQPEPTESKKPEPTKQPEPTEQPSQTNLTTSKNIEIVSENISSSDNSNVDTIANTSNEENNNKEESTLANIKKNLEKIITYIPDINKTELGNSFVGKDMITELVNQETLIKKMIGHAITNADILITEKNKYEEQNEYSYLNDNDINKKINEIFDKNKKIKKLIEKLFMNRKKSTIRWVN
jgi:hypothetical protein